MEKEQMKFLRNIWPTLIFIIILGGLIVAAFFVIKFTWKIFTGLDKQVAAAIVAGSATVLVSVITVVIGKNLEKKREIVQQHSMQKREFYEKFLEEFFRFTRKHSKEEGRLTQIVGPPIADEKLVEFFDEASRKLILWANKGVIKENSLFRSFGVRTSTSGSDPKILIQFEKMLFEIRKDLGHSNRGLKQGDLLSVYIEPQSLANTLNSLKKK